MRQDPQVERREVVASLLCSRLYLEMSLPERLALVKSLCAAYGPGARESGGPQGR